MIIHRHTTRTNRVFARTEDAVERIGRSGNKHVHLWANGLDGREYRVELSPKELVSACSQAPAVRTCDEVFGGDSKKLREFFDTLEKVLNV